MKYLNSAYVVYTFGDATVGDLHSNNLIDSTKLNQLSPISLNMESRLYAIGQSASKQYSKSRKYLYQDITRDSSHKLRKMGVDKGKLVARAKHYKPTKITTYEL